MRLIVDYNLHGLAGVRLLGAGPKDKFRFAFPKASNDLIDHLRDLQRQALGRLLNGQEALDVVHSFRADRMSLFEFLQPRPRRG